MRQKLTYVNGWRIGFLKTQINMKFTCQNCDEIFPRQPLYCPECGEEFINKSEKKYFKIFHPINNKMNHFLEENVEYEFVGAINADNLNQVFGLCQNSEDSQYSTFNKRSLSVGDIVVAPDDKQYFVAGVGYKETNLLTFETLVDG